MLNNLTICLNQIAGKINKVIRDEGLRDLGQVEQDLVFGDAGTKEVINYLRTYQVSWEVYIKHETTWDISNIWHVSLDNIFLYFLQDTKAEYKLRLMMIYAMVHPEKFEGDKATKLMQVSVCPNLAIKYTTLYSFILKKKKCF